MGFSFNFSSDLACYSLSHGTGTGPSGSSTRAATPATPASRSESPGHPRHPAISKLDMLIHTAISEQQAARPDASSLDLLCLHATKELSHFAEKNQPNPATSPAKRQRLPAKTPTAASPSPKVSIKVASPSVHTKRQRSGPSCDCCRARKIKCDSEISILSQIDTSLETAATTPPNAHIAHCTYLSTDPVTQYQYYKIVKDEEHSLNNKLTSFNYLQFKPCSACLAKSLNCSFSKGFTRNDIVKFNKSEKTLPNISALPTPTPSFSSPNVSDAENDVKVKKPVKMAKQAKPPSPLPSDNETDTVLVKERKSSKKTSCKTCRFKKIKCVKLNGADFCHYCKKKNIICLFE